MALVLKDRVKQTAAAPGTGTITLGATAAGFQSFASVGNGNTTYYAIVDPVSGDWEVNYGVYTSSGTTLTRNATPLSSSTGTLVNFTGTVDVFLTYPSEKAVWQDLSGVVAQQSFGAITATSAALTSGTITTAPVNATDIVNKEYADSIASGLNYHQPVNYASTAALPAYTYNNGSSGVGATITANANGALSLGGGSPTATQRVLVKDEVSGNAPYNGVYVVTQAGSAGTPFILTRATDYDTSGTGTNEIDQGDYVLVISGTLASTAWVQQTPLPITVGTTALTFLQFNAPITYTAGTGLNLSPATTFNISNTGVSASTYGSASAVPVFAVNAQGQITSVTNTNIAISGSAVSGNISGSAGSVANSLTLGTYLTGGSFNGSSAVTATVDATSANTASKVVARDSSGNFSAGTITATLSGSATSATTATNLAGGAANQIAYQSASGTTSFATAPSASNQVLSWNGSAFSWSAGTISGVPLGSNLNSLTAGTYLTGTAYNGSAAQTWAVDATSANTASKVVARDASGNFSAGTITAALSGNASTASQLNNSLTLATSGTGLSGSATFNGSSAQTFTVTSNATSANTASTIVARDGSGNFSAGTITASLSGNATSATTATTATTSTYSTYLSSVGSYVWNNATASTGYVNGISNAFVSAAEGFPSYGDVMTMNSYPGGGGALQLYSPYGSAYPDLNLRFRTADYSAGGAWTAWKIILDSANYNSYAPTLTGTGASGTWNISITGSAGSAPGYLPLSGGTMTGTITGGSGVSDLVTGNYAGALRGYLYNDTNGFGLLTYAGSWAVRVNYGTNTVYIPGIGYSDASLRAPIFYDTNDTSYYVDPASTSVLNILGSYYLKNNYDVSTDHPYGVYFSTGLSSAYAIYRTPGAWTHPYPDLRISFHTGIQIGANPNYGGVRFYTDYDMATEVMSVNNSAVGLGASNVYVNNSLVAGSDLRAPIFYDNNNTAYYVDPASTSNLSTTYIGGHLYTSYNSYNPTIRVSGASNAGLLLQDNSSAYMLQLYGVGSTYGFLASPWGAWDLRKVNGGALYLSNQSTYYYDSDVTYMYRVYGAADMRSPIYYDLDNTSYYLNPNGISVLSNVQANDWFRPIGDCGLYFQSYGYGLWAPQSGSNSYGNVTTYAIGRNGWTGYGLGSRITLMTDTNSSGTTTGLHDSNVGWYWRYVYDSYFIVDRGYSTFANSARAPLFYDSDNTAYYVDPASTSNLYTVTCNNYGSAGSSLNINWPHSGYINFWGTTGQTLNINNASGLQVNLVVSGNVTAYSDERRKHDWQDVSENYVQRLAAVRSGTYMRSDGGSDIRQAGVGAQSFYNVLPEVVTADENGYLSLAYGNAALVSAVELAKYVTALEQRISQLEARI